MGQANFDLYPLRVLFGWAYELNGQKADQRENNIHIYLIRVLCDMGALIRK